MECCLESSWAFSPHYFNKKPVPKLYHPKYKEAPCNVQPKFIHHQLVIISSCVKTVFLLWIGFFYYYFIVISVRLYTVLAFLLSFTFARLRPSPCSLSSVLWLKGRANWRFGYSETSGFTQQVFPVPWEGCVLFFVLLLIKEVNSSFLVIAVHQHKHKDRKFCVLNSEHCAWVASLFKEQGLAVYPLN